MAHDEKKDVDLGPARWDVILKLDALSKQNLHLEMLLKQKEEADARRHHSLTMQLNGLASMIASLPSSFWFRLGWRWFGKTVTLEAVDFRAVESAHEAMEERARQRIKLGVDMAKGPDRGAYAPMRGGPRSDIH